MIADLIKYQEGGKHGTKTCETDTFKAFIMFICVKNFESTFPKRKETSVMIYDKCQGMRGSLPDLALPPTPLPLSLFSP